VSGAFGGLVGNQGGIRSAAMLGLGVGREAFVATATAIALCVDAVRIPVYVATGWQRMFDAWPVILSATAGVIAGTLAGVGVLRRIPERIFRRLVAAILLIIGVALLGHAPSPEGSDPGQNEMPLPVLVHALAALTAMNAAPAGPRHDRAGSNRLRASARNGTGG
jgi:hypothetical protein